VDFDFLLIASAAVVGLLVGMTGVGGGAVMTPVLIIGFGVAPIVAVATDLIFATLTKVVGTVVHARQKTIDWAVAIALWRGSLPGVVLGLVVVLVLVSPNLDLITWLLIIALVGTSISMLRSYPLVLSERNRGVKATVGGGVIGFFVATTSVGAGALGMALLRALKGDRKPTELVGTDIVHAIPVALLAGAGYTLAGYLDFALLANLLVGSLPAVVLGSLLAARVRVSALRSLIAVMLLVAAVGVGAKTLGWL
jgi:uncharacterized protein